MCAQRSFMYTRENKGPRIEPCGTPAEISPQLEFFPFRTVDKHKHKGSL